MKTFIALFLILLTFNSFANEFDIKGKVISSSCKIDISNKYEPKEFNGLYYMLVFDLINKVAYISVTDGVEKNIPQAEVKFGNDYLDYAFFEANGGVETQIQFHSIWYYLSSLDLKCFSSYTEAIKFTKKNNIKCDINYSELDRYFEHFNIKNKL